MHATNKIDVVIFEYLLERQIKNMKEKKSQYHTRMQDVIRDNDAHYLKFNEIIN